MQSLKQFFLFCSGANFSILRRTPTEYNKYVGIGATIFFTGVFAAIAAGYALSTVFENSWLIVPVALLWGLMIFNLDRFIVSTMRKKGSFLSDFSGALPRIVLAVLIAIVIAKPLELKIFESEIDAELALMNQEQYKKQDDSVRERYTASIDVLKNEIGNLKLEIENKEEERDLLVDEAIKEADGTGGSMQKNLGPIYKTKRTAADLVQAELDDLKEANGLLINDKEKELAQLESDLNGEINTLERAAMGGFAARIEGLERAGQRSPAIWWASLFIMLLFIAIETAPVITKLILDRGPYDYALNKHEKHFEYNHHQIVERKENALNNERAFNAETSDYKTKLAILAEKELAEEAIKRRVEELKGATTLSRDIFNESSLLGS